MRIAIITAGVLPIPTVRGGAVETLVEYLIDENEKHKKYNFTIFSIGDDEIKEEMLSEYQYTNFVFINKNLKDMIEELLTKILFKLFKKEKTNIYLKKVIKEIKKADYEYIVIENRSQYVLPISKVNKNIILHLHNSYLNKDIKGGERVFDNCAKIITVSEFIKKQVETIKISNKVQVLKNCVDLKRFDNKRLKQEKVLYRNKLGVKEKDIVIIFSGRIVPEKGIRELLKAFKLLVKDYNVKLCVVGATWYSDNKQNTFTEELKEIIKEVQQKVIFTGYVPFQEMPKVYGIADIAVIPSMWDDPAPLVVFESMAIGLPIVATYSGGIPEYVNEECAILVNRDKQIVDSLYKALKKLIEDEQLRIRMGNAAIKNVQQFNTERYYEDFTNLIKK